jgi:hypothetical protein
MPAASLIPLPSDALEANRRGELSDKQLLGFRARSRYQRRNALTIAAFLVAGAVLVGVFASPTAPVVPRVLITGIALTIAAFLVVRSITGSDALTRDLRHVTVQSVEGAIGKRRIGNRGGPAATSYFLDVGDASFKVTSGTYASAPDAGFVRLYFLPRSRKIVNLERLSGAPLPHAVSVKDLANALGPALRSHNRRERNEARAGIADMADTVAASFVSSPVSRPSHSSDPRPLDEVIVGTWSNVMMKVTFSAGGRVTIQMPGTKKDGHWSVDGAGRLRADITGQQATGDASVSGNQLTITIDGEGMTFTREDD